MFHNIQWDDLRRKGWLMLLTLGAAYVQTDPRFGWAVPVLTVWAGISSPPTFAPASVARVVFWALILGGLAAPALAYG